MAAIHARRALALLGTPFRPQGRDPELGLDCIGLCLTAFDLPATFVRDDYRLKGEYREEFKTAVRARFREVSSARAKVGDLVLMLPAADQLHLGILTSQGIVHADARLRRVVETPGAPQWPVGGMYRFGARSGC